MEMHSNICDLHEARETAETVAQQHMRRAEMKPKAAVASVDLDSVWYHDAAIEAARREAIDTRCHPVHW